MKVLGLTAAVTGGASGIGRATVSALAREGAKTVYVLDVNDDLGHRVSSEMNADLPGDREIIKYYHCDLRNEKSIKEFFQHVKEDGGQVDILVNSAGMCVESAWQAMLDINLKALIAATYAAIDHMGKDSNDGHGGVIVNIGSMAGIVTVPSLPVYCATKHAVVSLSRALGCEEFYSKHGVRITCVCPNSTDTPLMNNLLENSETRYRSDWKTLFVDSKQLKLMSADKVASAVLGVIHDDSLVGQVVAVQLGQEPYTVDFPSMDDHLKY